MFQQKQNLIFSFQPLSGPGGIWQAAPGVPLLEPGALQLVPPLEQGGELARFSLLAAPWFLCFWAVGSESWVVGAERETSSHWGLSQTEAWRLGQF